MARYVYLSIGTILNNELCQTLNNRIERKIKLIKTKPLIISSFKSLFHI